MKIRISSSVAAALVALAALTSSAQSATTVPNPCSLVPVATIATTLGIKGVVLTGKLSKRPDNGTTQSLCTYKDGAIEIQIQVAPHEPVGGVGGVPGMKHASVTGLGSTATDFYDTTAPNQFANVSFTKGALDASAYDSSTIPNAKMVALARLVYRALP